MITFKTTVRIERPIEDVYSYVSEPRNFPYWNSAVQIVRKTSGGGDNAVGSTYSMERTLPTGRAENELEIDAREFHSEFTIRTTSGPTPFVYRYSFASANGETVVQLDAAIELEGIAAFCSRQSRRVPSKEEWTTTSPH